MLPIFQTGVVNRMGRILTLPAFGLEGAFQRSGRESLDRPYRALTIGGSPTQGVALGYDVLLFQSREKVAAELVL